MAFKLNKDQLTRKRVLTENYEAAKSNFEDAIREANMAIKSAIEDADRARKEYNDVVDEIKTFTDEVATEHRNTWDERSETWQTVEDWLSNWENYELATIDEFEDIELELLELDDEPFTELEDEAAE